MSPCGTHPAWFPGVAIRDRLAMHRIGLAMKQGLSTHELIKVNSLLLPLATGKWYALNEVFRYTIHNTQHLDE